MDYIEDFQKALEISNSAVSFLKDRKQPPHPRNFTLLYTYYLNKLPALREEVDQVLASGREVSPELLTSLYDKYVTNNREELVIREASETIESTLNMLLQHMNEASQNNTEYDNALRQFSGSINPEAIKAGGMEGLRKAVMTVLSETQKMQANNRKLETRLAETNTVIGELRENLDTVRQEALTDALTGLFNRRAFDMKLQQQMSYAAAESRPLALLMTDIDHFKLFNDKFGHHTGDQVLKLVANNLVECVRGHDIGARYGGEEFAVILPETNLDGAFTVAENIRTGLEVRELTRKSTGENLGQITISLGIAVFRPGEDVAQFISRADEGLYRSKSGGRNRTSSVEIMDHLPTGILADLTKSA